ncbi:MAG: metal ABC transporter substrate-binding protein, partial [Deltaproteobacteria bacterium]|nr:metal ABC transporter substrate-binding protein [Deltaproteobacteria bacterium]
MRGIQMNFTNSRRRLVLPALALAALLAPASPAATGDKIKAVATISIFGDLLRHVGGEHLDVKVLEPPGRDVHFYEPTPSDIVKISKADLFVHGGLDLELWRGPLIEASANVKIFPGGPGDVAAVRGITLLDVPSGNVSRAQGDVHVSGNPHFWLDPENLAIIANTISERLAELDPANAASYQQNLANFHARLDAAIPRWKARLAPFAGKPVAAYHNSWPYFARAFDLRIDTFLEPKPNIPPSGAHLKKVEALIGKEGIRAILIEPFNHRAY